MYISKSKIFIITLLISISIQAQIKTPLEKSDFKKLSSYQDMMFYLNDIVNNSELLSMKIIGNSVQKRKIPALFFSKEKIFGERRKVKPIVLIYAQQHGNEPAGKEAALVISRKLINEDKYLLDHLDIIMVPQVNPDGSEIETRKNANKMDLNRNHVILSEPESQALHNLFLEWLPEVTLDIHETDVLKKDWIEHGIIKDAEEMFGTVTNLNISEKIRDYSKNTFLTKVGRKIVKDGFTYHEYIVGSPFNGRRIRFSTTNINDGRQSMGIYNTLSFVVECKRYGDTITKLRRRVAGHVSGIEAFLTSIDEDYKNILKMVKNERQKLTDEKNLNDRIAIQMDYYPDPKQPKLEFPVFNFYTWHHEIQPLDHYEPLVKIKKTVTKPYAYVFSSDEEELIALLKKHQIKMKKLSKDFDITVEEYKILNIAPSREEDKASLTLDLERNIIKKHFKTGDIIILLKQKSSNLIPLLLEPESSIGIVSKRSGRKYRFDKYIQDNKDYPIYRINNPIEFPVK